MMKHTPTQLRLSSSPTTGDDGGSGEVQQAVRILVVEDNEIDALIVDRALKSTVNLEYRVEHVDTLAAAFKSVFSNAFDVILLDLGLPDGSAMDGLGRLVTMLDVPIVVLTGHDCGRIANKALARGAQDFVSKAEDLPVVLSRTIQFAIQRHQVQAALTRTEQMLTVQKEFSKLQSMKLQQRLDQSERLAGFAEHTDQSVAIVNSSRILEWCNAAFRARFLQGRDLDSDLLLDVCLDQLEGYSQKSQVEWAIASHKKLAEHWETQSGVSESGSGRIEVVPLPHSDGSLHRCAVSISLIAPST